ncbi:MAG: InlB B-repeat-containing protein [Clostridia bacterium]|nr:InlB B-repeat-containing protein [Clostridia bacterium]
MKTNRLLSIILSVVLVALMMVPAFGTVSAADAPVDTVVYLASYGSDENDGSEAAPFATLQKAWTNGNTGNNHTIIVVDNVALNSTSFIWGSENKAAHTTLKGATADVVLDLSIKVRMGIYSSGGLTFENITLKFDQTQTDGVPNAKFYCNAKHVVFAETVSFADNAPINIFAGGNNIAAGTGSTNLEVYGGYYYYIYGGGENTVVNGDVNLTVGGNVNAGESIDDESSNVAQARIYGGGFTTGVTGDVNINYGGNAIARVLTGTGRTGGEVGGKININVTGGKVTTISATKNVNDTDADVHITMTGGLCEAIFGGGESCSLTGNTVVYVGGTADVSRRIHGGCYNESPSSGTNRVIGSATVIIDAGCSLASGTDLSFMNRFYMAINAGSRLTTDAADEISTLVFLNDTYSTYSGDISSNYGQDHIVKVAAGGTVDSAMNGTAALTVLPNEGNLGIVGTKTYASGQICDITAATTDVTFAAPDAVVTYNYNNDTDMTATQKMLNGYIGKIIETPDDIAKQYYNFVGWSTEADGGVEYVAGDDIAVTGDITLYAVWVGVDMNYTVMHIAKSHVGDGTIVFGSDVQVGKYGAINTPVAKAYLGYTYQAGDVSIEPNQFTLGTVYYTPVEGNVFDVNLDGAVNMLDTVLLKRYFAEWDGYDLTKICYHTSDVNLDGKVDLTDAVQVQRYLAGWEDVTAE